MDDSAGSPARVDNVEVMRVIEFLIGFAIGALVGGTVGMVSMGLMVATREEFQRYR